MVEFGLITAITLTCYLMIVKQSRDLQDVSVNRNPALFVGTRTVVSVCVVQLNTGCRASLC